LFVIMPVLDVGSPFFTALRRYGLSAGSSCSRFALSTALYTCTPPVIVARAGCIQQINYPNNWRCCRKMSYPSSLVHSTCSCFLFLVAVSCFRCYLLSRCCHYLSLPVIPTSNFHFYLSLLVKLFSFVKYKDTPYLFKPSHH
jgi:hypothetical protein